MRPRGNWRLAPWLLALAGYTALTLTMMWPVVAHISSAFPHDASDPALNTWILWWNAHAIPLTERWRNAPMFWPMLGSLSLSEHLVGIGVLTTPLRWVGLRPVTAYNVAWLVSFPLCALAAHALAFAIVKRHDGATLAGLVFGFSPYRIAQAPHLQTLWAFGIPLALFALHRYVEERKRVWLAVFAAAWVMQALANGYYLVFFPVLLAFWVVWFTIGRSRTGALAIAGVWVVAWLPLIPFLLTYRQTQGALNLGSVEKPMSIALRLATILLLTSRSMARLWRDGSVLAFYVLAAALTYTLSLGPHVRFAGAPLIFRAPYFWLLQVPGFSSARAPGRFGMLFVLCLAVAAALVFARATHAFGRRARYALAAAACVVIVAESWPTIAVAAVPAPIRALEHADANAPVLELPAGSTDRDSAALYRSIEHGRPVVNGYSGYVPPHYRVLTVSLRLDDAAVLTELARHSPLTVAIDRRDQFERWAAVVAQCHGDLIDDDGEWRVYRVPSVGRAPAPAGATLLHIASVSANVGPDWVSRMLDGDPWTAWNSRRVQAGGEEVAIDLGAERFVTALRLTIGPFIGDFPRRLVVDEHGDWRPCWSGSASGLALRAVLEDSRTAPMTISIGLDHIRRLRLRQTGVDPMNGWSIGELAVLGR